MSAYCIDCGVQAVRERGPGTPLVIRHGGDCPNRALNPPSRPVETTDASARPIPPAAPDEATGSPDALMDVLAQMPGTQLVVNERVAALRATIVELSDTLAEARARIIEKDDAMLTAMRNLIANDDTIKRFDRERQGFKAAIAQRDAEVERLSADLLADGMEDDFDDVVRLRLDLSDALVEVGRLSIILAARDATIDRLWRQLNEATNVPGHNDPEFGFDKTAALSDADEDDGREALATRLRALCDDAEDRRDWVRVADLRAMLGTS